MAASKVHSSEERKRRRSKKNRSRTVVSVSSSESDSDVSDTKTGNSKAVSEENASITSPEPPKRSKKAKAAKMEPMQESHGDTQMNDTDATAALASASEPQAKPSPKDSEDFASIYLRKVTVELADDLDKVREAKDFKSSSLPMLIHALKQGESMYSAEEKRRVVSAASP